MKDRDLTCEMWREYDFGGRVYRINDPQRLITSESGTTHRVVDSGGIVHCLPAPGHQGCVLRWQSRDEAKPVAF